MADRRESRNQQPSSAGGGDQYSIWVGLVFIFNLLFGTGILAMPKIFSQAGYIAGSICLILLSFVSFIQTTFLIETMANANFVKRVNGGRIGTATSYDSGDQSERSALLSHPCNGDDDDDDEDLEPPASNLLQKHQIRNSNNIHALILGTGGSGTGIGGQNRYTSQATLRASRDSVATETDDHQQSDDHLYDLRFEIDEKFELGNMTELFLNRFLSKFFFFSIICYLFGDLVIYNAMMAKSTRELICTSAAFCNVTEDHESATYMNALCWDGTGINHRWAYRICLIVFVAILLPLAYFKLQKTKVIQVLTIALRWIAFSSIIAITIKVIVTKETPATVADRPKMFDILHVPQLFGLCVYAFMVHHSVPSMVTPIRNKRRLVGGILYDYILVLVFMVIIGVSAVFAFDSIQSVYTLNFQIDKCRNHTNPASVPGLNIFLPTFPIFTTFSSYPIIAGTLINNMKVLVNMPDNRWVNWAAPMVAIIPSAIIAFFTEDVSQIVSYVGSYTGTLIQYVFPCLLAYHSRRYVQTRCLQTTTTTTNDQQQQQRAKLYHKLNPYASPFHSKLWIYFTGIWYVVVVTLVTIQHIWVPPDQHRRQQHHFRPK